MEEDSYLWNMKNLHAPPISTYKAESPKGVENLCHTFGEAVKFFTNLKHLHAEAALLSRAIYKMKMKYRSDKGFKYLLKLNRCLLQYLNMDFVSAIKLFSELIPEKRELNVYIPSRNMLDYILVRLQGLTMLLSRIIETSQLTAYFMEHKISNGDDWKTALVFLGITSRIWVIAKNMVKFCCQFYLNILKFRNELHVVGPQWIPNNYQFPDNLENWLVKHQTSEIKHELSLFQNTESKFVERLDELQTKIFMKDSSEYSGEVMQSQSDILNSDESCNNFYLMLQSNDIGEVVSRSNINDDNKMENINKKLSEEIKTDHVQEKIKSNNVIFPVRQSSFFMKNDIQNIKQKALGRVNDKRLKNNIVGKDQIDYILKNINSTKEVKIDRVQEKVKMMTNKQGEVKVNILNDYFEAKRKKQVHQTPKNTKLTEGDLIPEDVNEVKTDHLQEKIEMIINKQKQVKVNVLNDYFEAKRKKQVHQTPKNTKLTEGDSIPEEVNELKTDHLQEKIEMITNKQRQVKVNVLNDYFEAKHMKQPNQTPKIKKFDDDSLPEKNNSQLIKSEVILNDQFEGNNVISPVRESSFFVKNATQNIKQKALVQVNGKLLKSNIVGKDKIENILKTINSTNDLRRFLKKQISSRNKQKDCLLNKLDMLQWHMLQKKLKKYVKKAALNNMDSESCVLKAKNLLRVSLN